MEILVFNGSPRERGNTAAFTEAFREGAESAGHRVTVLPLAKMNVHPCRGCDACRRAEDRVCVVRDDMQKIYPLVKTAEMIVLASPVHYWNYSAHLQTAIARLHPFPVPPAKKYALILSSAARDVSGGIQMIYETMLSYFKAENTGILIFEGEDQKTEENLARVRAFAAGL